MHNKNRVKNFIFSCAAVLCGSLAASAASDEPEGKVYDLGDAPAIIIKVPSKPTNIGRGLEVEVNIAVSAQMPASTSSGSGGGATAGKSGIVFRQVSICPPPEVRLIWTDTKCGMVALDEREIEIAPGQALTRTVVLNEETASNEPVDLVTRLRRFYHYITFEPGDYRFLVQFKYNRQGSLDPRFIDRDVVVSLRPPLSSIVIGACLGAALLSVFLLVMGLWNSGSRIGGGSIATLLGRFFGVLSIGSVSAVIFVALTFRLKSDTLPIAVTVNDFYGGVVVGLFTFKISSWLYAQLEDLGGTTSKITPQSGKDNALSVSDGRLLIEAEQPRIST